MCIVIITEKEVYKIRTIIIPLAPFDVSSQAEFWEVLASKEVLSSIKSIEDVGFYEEGYDQKFHLQNLALTQIRLKIDNLGWMIRTPVHTNASYL